MLLLKTLLFFGIINICILQASIYNYDSEYDKQAQGNSIALTQDDYNMLRENIVKLASSYLDKNYKYSQRVTLKNSSKDEEKIFRFDCSGFVSAVFWLANVSVFEKQASLAQSGTATIYNTLKKFDKVYSGTPQAGDIIFFSRTTSSEKPLSHVGIVVSVASDNTVAFIHMANSGIKKGYINLDEPDVYQANGKILNSYVRGGVGTDGLASKCFESFGTIFDKP